MTLSYADQRARLTRLWERVHRVAPPDDWPPVMHLHPADPDQVPLGYSAWAVGEWDEDPNAERQIVVVPTLTPGAPYDLWKRYLAHIVGLGAGVCPMCNQPAGLSREPPAPGEPGHAIWHMLPLRVVIKHPPGCPAATFTSEDRAWFPALDDNDDEQEE